MVAEVIRQLKDTPSRNEKLAILEQHRDNELLKEVFEATFDPYTSYYIRKIPEYRPAAPMAAQGMTLGVAIDELARFARRELTGNAAIEHLRSLLSQLNEDDAFVLERIIQKDLDCGVQTSTVNKVWKGLISEYPCLLAQGFSEKSIANIQFPAYSQLKLDGMRANLFHEKDGSVHIRGRSGKAIDLLGAMDDAIREIVPKGFVLDGELVMAEDDGTLMPRKKGNGMLNKAIKGTISEAEAARARATVWDVIPIEDFHKGRTTIRYQARITHLQTMLKSGHERISLVEWKVVASLEEATEHFQEMLSRGEEGTILKNVNHVWEDKRSKCLVKMKAEKDADLVVVDWQEGTGKYAGMMGALICRSSDGKVEVSIGGGYTDEERRTFTREAMVGKVVTVLYNERISSKAGGPDSLFLPRFVEVREDKTVANSSKEIK